MNNVNTAKGMNTLKGMNKNIQTQSVVKPLSIRQISIPIILSIVIFIILFSGYLRVKQLKQSLDDYSPPMSWAVKDVRNSIDSLIETTRASLSIIYSVNKGKKTSNSEPLIFDTIKRLQPYISGIGTIDASGKIISETGVSLSASYDFSESLWLKNCRTFGYSVSEIYSNNIQIQGIKKEDSFFIIAVNTDTDIVVYSAITINGLSEYLRNKVKGGLLSLVDVYLIIQSPENQTPKQIRILTNGNNSLKPIEQGFSPAHIKKLPYIQPDGILVDVDNQESFSTWNGYAKIENTPWTLVITLGPKKQPYLPFLLNSNLIAVVLGSVLLIIYTTYIIILMRKNILIANIHIKQSPLKNMESFTKKSSMGHLSESMVHEINNPLEIINQNAGLLKDILNMSGDVKSIGDMKLKDKFISLTDGILEGVDRSRHVMNRFLKFAKTAEPQIAIGKSKQDVDVNIVLQEIVDLCKEEAMYRDIQIELKQGQDLAHVTKGMDLLQQIFFNILSFIINDVKKDTSVIISSKNIDSSNIEVLFNYSKMISNTNKRADMIAINARRDNVIEHNDIRLSVSNDFIDKLGGSMKTEALDENGMSIIFKIPTGD